MVFEILHHNAANTSNGYSRRFRIHYIFIWILLSPGFTRSKTVHLIQKTIFNRKISSPTLLGTLNSAQGPACHRARLRGRSCARLNFQGPKILLNVCAHWSMDEIFWIWRHLMVCCSFHSGLPIFQNFRMDVCWNITGIKYNPKPAECNKFEYCIWKTISLLD